MNYETLQHLLERYERCETSEAEERTLREYFASEPNIPDPFSMWREIFAFEREESTLEMPESLAQRLAAQARLLDTAAPVSPVASKGETRRAIKAYFRPFTRSAAAVAMLTLVGLAAQEAFSPTDEEVRTQQFNAQEWTLRQQAPGAPLEADAALADTLLAPPAASVLP